MSGLKTRSVPGIVALSYHHHHHHHPLVWGGQALPAWSSSSEGTLFSVSLPCRGHSLGDALGLPTGVGKGLTLFRLGQPLVDGGLCMCVEVVV